MGKHEHPPVPPCPPVTHCMPLPPCPPPVFGCPSDCCPPKTTKYYHLPLWRANDTTSWLYGLNNAFMQIDALFHQFALRTGICGSADELSETVEKLEMVVECLQGDNCKTLKDLSELTKVVADSLANQELLNEKLSVLQKQVTNVGLRVQNLETAGAASSNELNELKDQLTILSQRVTDLENPTMNPPEEPEEGGNEDGNNEL